MKAICKYLILYAICQSLIHGKINFKILSGNIKLKSHDDIQFFHVMLYNLELSATPLSEFSKTRAQFVLFNSKGLTLQDYEYFNDYSQNSLLEMYDISLSISK